MSSSELNEHWATRLRQNGLALFDQMLVSVGNALTTFIVGRLGSEEQLGLFFLGNTVVLLATSILDSVVGLPYVFLSGRKQGETRDAYAGSALLETGLIALGISLMVAAVAWIAADRITEGLAGILLLVSLVIPLHLGRLFVRRYQLSRMQLGRLVLFDGIALVTQVGILFFAWRLGGVYGTTGHLAAGVGGLTVFVTWAALTWSTIRITANWKQDVAEQWGLGKSILASQISWMLHLHLLTWMLAQVHGTRVTGRYAACMTVVMLANPFVLGMLNVFSPRAASSVAQGGLPALKRVVWQNSLLLMSGGAVICAIQILFGDAIVRLLYGEGFAGQQWAITILALAMAAETVCKGPEQGLQALDKPYLMARMNHARLLITLLLAGWLIPSRGVIGAAWSLLASDLFGACGLWMLFYSCTAERPENIARATPATTPLVSNADQPT